MYVSFLLAAAIALVIVAVARLTGALSRGGSLAAFVVGTIAIAAGWSWTTLLLAYFISSSALSRYGAGRKESRTAAVVEKGGARDAAQVLANGLGFTVAAALALIPDLAASPDIAMRLAALGAGTLASSASDTWATEIGTLVGATPRSITTGRPVEIGRSGGITIAGTLAAVIGAGFVAVVARTVGWDTRIALAAWLGGMLGSTLDSVLGATVQARRWCVRCQRGTERAVHDCGTPTRNYGGLSWLGNDAVNLVSTSVGGLLAMLLSR